MSQYSDSLKETSQGLKSSAKIDRRVLVVGVNTNDARNYLHGVTSSYDVTMTSLVAEMSPVA